VPSDTAATQPILVAIMSLFAAGRHGHGHDGPSLTITGDATPTAEPAAFYTFTPNVFQRSARALKFTILNKPAWASFGLRHGTLYGTPKATQAGMYSNIIITVSDGEKTVQLPPFSIRVDAPVAVATPANSG
jgi:hypothetical protein